MGYFNNLAKSVKWSGKVKSHPVTGDAVHFSHPQFGVISITKDDNKYHVRHNGVYAGILNEKGVFDNPKDAAAHAKKYMEKISAGGKGNILRGSPSPESQPIKKPLFLKNESDKLKSLNKAKVDEGKTIEQKRRNRAIRNWHKPKQWTTKNPAHEGQFHGIPKTPSAETSGVHHETGTFTTGGYKTYKDRGKRDKIDIQADHAQAMRGIKKLKPNLPKSEFKKAVNESNLHKDDGDSPPKNTKKSLMRYFTLRKLSGSPTKVKTIMDCPKDHDPIVNNNFERMILSRMSGLKKDDGIGSQSKPDILAQQISDAPKSKSRNYDLFTDEMANAKTAKSGKRGEYLSAIFHLAPADLASDKTVCPFATEGCRHACLNTSGRGGMLNKEYDLNDIQLARIRKTKEFHDDPHSFLKRISNDIDKLKLYAKQDGRKPVVRLNGTSDINWAALKSHALGGKNIFEAHPDVQFYDYTKNPYIVKNNKHPNYHVTFSYADGEKNQKTAEELLKLGHNVAVVFGGKKDGKAIFPKTFKGHEVINGDETDLRHLDPRGGKVVGLSAKADAMHDTTGFVQWGHEGEPDSRPRPKPETGRYERVKRSTGQEKIQAYKEAKKQRSSSPEAIEAKIAKLKNKLNKLKGIK